MKTILFFLFIINSLVSLAQLKTQVNFLHLTAKENSDTIYFKSNQKLVWDDFDGPVLQKGMAIAETSSGFGFNASFKTINNKSTLIVNVFCYFDKAKSWVKPDKKSDYALQHEQNHFTISYIATNNFYKRLKSARFTKNNYNDLLNEIYTISMEDLEKMQNDYDKQTRNGINKTIQADWNKKIAKQLKAITIR